MDSGTLGANDNNNNNSDLNPREKLRWGDNSKVYTRKNFRKKPQFLTSNYDFATTSTAGDPAKDEFGSKNGTLERLSLVETLEAKSGNFTEEQLQARSEGEPWIFNVVRLPEEGASDHEAVRSGGEDPHVEVLSDVHEAVVLSDVHEAVPNDGSGEEVKRNNGSEAGEEPLPGTREGPEVLPVVEACSGHEAQPEMQPTGGQEEVLTDGGKEEEQTQRDVQEGEKEALTSTREDHPLKGDQEDLKVLPDVQEEVPGIEEATSSSGHEALPEMQPTVSDGQEDVLPNGGEEELMRCDGQGGGKEALPSSGEDPLLEGDKKDQEVLPDVQEGVHNDGGREDPRLSSSHEGLSEMQSDRGQEVVLPNGGEEEPSHSGGQEGEKETLLSTREDMPLERDHEDQEVLPDVQDAIFNDGGREKPVHCSDNEALPGGGEEEPKLSSGGHEVLTEMQSSGGQEKPTQMDGPEAEQEALASTTEDPPLEGGQKDPEVLPDVEEVSVPDVRREEPTSISGHETLPEIQPSGGLEVLPNGGDAEPKQSDRQEAGKEGLPIAREELLEREQSEMAVTVPMTERPDVTGDVCPVNGAASTVLENGFSKPVITRVKDRVRINITGSRLKDEMRKLKRKLESELDQVRSLVEEVEAKEHQLTAYNTSDVNTNSRYVGGSVRHFGGYNQPQLIRANSEVGTVGHPYSRPQLLRVNSEVGSVGYQDARSLRQLSVSVVENNHGTGEYVEKEKRTPKANQYYRNSEFLLGKDRLPPESNKKLKLSAKKHGGDSEYGYGFGIDKNRDKVLRNCSNLLQRLMKHKHGWVFNEPVDAKKLNIPDYHLIIKHPMDFGTIKTRLSQNWYKSAREFAEDVRLVFRNAMTYNPKGQDVHTMAEELSNIFEERWIATEKEIFPYQMYYDAGLPIPTPRKAAPPPVFARVSAPVLASVTIPHTLPMRTLDRSESMTVSVDSRLKPSYLNLPHVGRTPVPKKPKAKDPNKRDMTYEEKQKLSTNLQNLPSEKLDAIVQIIKKRNSALSQHDDEIEVDIDNVDAETLWELDRFVTNYKKSLSKNKRKAELALQRRAEAAQAVPATNPIPAVVEVQKESTAGEKSCAPVVEVEKQGDNVSGSSSSSSSSSDSGSSSSDSDSDSSSAYGSDAGHSPKT